jgi:hypothetical protein
MAFITLEITDIRSAEIEYVGGPTRKVRYQALAIGKRRAKTI